LDYVVFFNHHIWLANASIIFVRF